MLTIKNNKEAKLEAAVYAFQLLENRGVWKSPIEVYKLLNGWIKELEGASSGASFSSGGLFVQKYTECGYSEYRVMISVADLTLSKEESAIYRP